MKRLFIICLLAGSLTPAIAQVGIGTNNPASTLDIRGSLALNMRSFSSNTTLSASDYHLLFNGSSNVTVTLPDATACPGRIYYIKNSGSGSPLPAITLATTGGQTLNGSATLELSYSNEVIAVVSDGAGWSSFSHSIPQASGLNWATGGNTVSTERSLGTLNNYALPFITNNTERMRLTAAGKLGMGIAAPITEQHIFASSTPSGITSTYIKGLTITGTGTWGFGGPGFYLENTDNPVNKKLFKMNFTANGGTDSYINFQAVSDNGASNVNANILAVMHSGRVGIGTATFDDNNPEKLLVDAGYTFSRRVLSARGVMSGDLQFNMQNFHGGEEAKTSIVAMADNGAEDYYNIAMGINSDGNTQTDIMGGYNTTYLVGRGENMVIGNTTADKDLIFFTGGTDLTNERMRLNALGLTPGADNTYALGSSTNRWKEVWSANGVIQTSDARLKTNIRNLHYGLKEVMQLRPVSYDWKSNTNEHKIGLIAQEVQLVVPEVVTGDPASQTLGMNYAELVPVLINAVQELKTEVDNLKKEIEQLKKNKKDH